MLSRVVGQRKMTDEQSSMISLTVFVSYSIFFSDYGFSLQQCLLVNSHGQAFLAVGQSVQVQAGAIGIDRKAIADGIP